MVELRGKQYLEMTHGKATDTLACLFSEDSGPKRASGITVIERNGVTVKMMRDRFRTGTHKLLSVALIQFYGQNDTKKGIVKNLLVKIPLKQYSELCGVNKEGAVATEEEKQRIGNAEKDFRKKIKKDLEILAGVQITWSEKVRGEEKSFGYQSLISGYEFSKGYICIEISERFAEYLVSIPATQYPLVLFGIDERDRNTYSLGLRMSEYYNMYSNINKRDHLRVRSLLGYTGLPERNSTSVKRVGWRSRIKEPLERSLDSLVRYGLLEKWQYGSMEGENEEDRECGEETFEEWTDSMVYFELKNAPNPGAGSEA